MYCVLRTPMVFRDGVMEEDLSLCSFFMRYQLASRLNKAIGFGS
jgi:hypothetical protein